jgi:hypothetical protein
LSQSAVSAELAVIGSLTNATLGSPFDSRLLLGYFNLDLDRQNTQKSTLSGVKGVGQSMEWALPLIAESSRALPFILDNTPVRLDAHFEKIDELGVTFPNTFLRDFSREERGITINPLPVPLVLPAIAQAPAQSNAPNFFSLVMLCTGGVALLGWLRAKRQKQRVYPGSHSRT